MDSRQSRTRVSQFTHFARTHKARHIARRAKGPAAAPGGASAPVPPSGLGVEARHGMIGHDPPIAFRCPPLGKGTPQEDMEGFDNREMSPPLPILNAGRFAISNRR